MKWKLLAMLLIVAILLAACGYVVVEDPERQTIGSILMPAAFAEDNANVKSDMQESLRPLPTMSDSISDTQTPEPKPEPVKLTRGSRGETVKELQTLLREYGFLMGKADGSFGAQTQAAVKAAQEYKHSIDLKKAREAREALVKKLNEASQRTLDALLALVPENVEAATVSEAKPLKLKNVEHTFFTANTAQPAPEKQFSADGEADEAFIDYLKHEFAPYAGDLKKGSAGSDVRRLQTRLNAMYYLYGGIDASYGSNTQSAVKYFQRLNGLKETGIADRDTQKLLFSSKCKVSDYPMYNYRVEISVSKQKVYVYKWNYGAYDKLVKTMKCTTGAIDTPTPLGTFKMGGPCGRWYYFSKFECWAQYASRIYSGILFHSVLYSEKDERTLRQGSVNALGSRASHGCVRLSVDDAKWIYNNIPAGTSCKIYN